ncbi:MAG: hypothetical protein JO320_26535 [Alphaproteobacteria bacterium]|nr:hypothetical protein [Alphaproteobacteria bacterium]MBV9200996.1 hypothetical protein [Alphaproteobacteria bacterium]MBV9378561.1 hypothetical protein [Alphaproteobacteria bacterium]MBV9816264.1 hypothetical protein [Alphaproteobacteria bacterium]
METTRLFLFNVTTVVAAAVAVANLSVQSITARGAAYDYVAPQVAPPVAANLGMADIAAILNETAPNPPYFVAYQLTTTDTHDNLAGAAPLKVVPTDDAQHSFLGVFHNQINSTQFAAYLGYSSDLRVWHTIGQIHSPASQPDLRILPDDSVVYAEEYNPSGRPYVRVQYYGDGGVTGLQALIANPAVVPTEAITLPGTAFAKADGTPEFGRISYSGAMASSTIEITHHYYYLGQRDLEADGTLTSFKSWSSPSDTTVDNLVTNAGGNGKIGDREIFTVGSQVFEVVEAQVNPASGNDYGSWRLFLVNRTAGAIQKLSPALAGGAQSLGNPTVSFVTLPTGVSALVFTCFVFGANNGTTPLGGHIFVYPLEQ